MPKLLKTTPIFRMFDVQKAREFYIDYLGFELVFEHRFSETAPLYMGLQRDEQTLHLSEHHGDSTPGSAVRIQVEDIDGFHAELHSKEYNFANPGIETPPWGSREVTVKDPFGNRVVFWEEGADQSS